MEQKLLDVIENWDTFRLGLMSLSEDEVKAVLEHELTNEKRKSYVSRIHARYSILRSARERAALIAGLK